MNQYDSEALRVSLNAEKAELAALRKAYTEALKDVKIKILRLKQRKPTPGTAQTIEYQLGYAFQQEAELTAILERLNKNVVASAQEYLQASYDHGFLGTAYTLHGQGVPVAIGIDQRAMAEAVQMRTAGLKFSERLYKENLEALKTRYLSTLARGLGGGMSFSQIASQLSLDTGISLRRAYTIARTEGARVYEVARQHGMAAAKAKGADIVKQWSSTLDLVTRPLHGKLDGQIREIEEPYEVDGMTAMHPLGFGIAAMDVNCRCKSITRARWMVEAEQADEAGTRTKWDGERGQLVPYQPFEKWAEEYKREYGSMSGAELQRLPNQPIPQISLQKKQESAIIRASETRILREPSILPGESGIIDLPHERAIGYDANGKQVLEIEGEAHHVDLKPSQLQRIRGGILSHNHPGGLSFSGEDIYLLKNWGIKEIRAVTKSGVYYIRPPEKWDESLKTLSDLKSARNRIMLEIRDDPAYMAKRASIKSMKDWQMFMHAETNRVFAERYGFTYGRIDWQ